MASLTALAEFHAIFPAHRSKEIQFSISRGKTFMKSIQRPDGSWYVYDANDCFHQIFHTLMSKLHRFIIFGLGMVLGHVALLMDAGLVLRGLSQLASRWILQH